MREEIYVDSSLPASLPLELNLIRMSMSSEPKEMRVSSILK